MGLGLTGEGDGDFEAFSGGGGEVGGEGLFVAEGHEGAAAFFEAFQGACDEGLEELAGGAFATDGELIEVGVEVVVDDEVAGDVEAHGQEQPRAGHGELCGDGAGVGGFEGEGEVLNADAGTACAAPCPGGKDTGEVIALCGEVEFTAVGAGEDDAGLPAVAEAVEFGVVGDESDGDGAGFVFEGIGEILDAGGVPGLLGVEFAVELDGLVFASDAPAGDGDAEGVVADVDGVEVGVGGDEALGVGGFHAGGEVGEGLGEGVAEEGEGSAAASAVEEGWAERFGRRLGGSVGGGDGGSPSAAVGEGGEEDQGGDCEGPVRRVRVH